MLGSANRKPMKGQQALIQAIAKEFRGGLNTYDSPLTVKSTYATELRNMYPDASGALRVRFGTTQFSSLSTYGTNIIAMEYYINALIAVMNNGVVVKVDSAGVTTPIWNTAIAATRPGAPAAWSTTAFASFAQFGGKLIICNGADKPLIVDNAFLVNYLADAGTGSNVNVPRAKYVVTHNNYLIMAVTPTNSTTIYITSKGTSGTFFGDPAPNDATNFDTATFITRGVPEITGLGSFRDKLVVFYDENVITLKLGGYDGATHLPVLEDVVENFGAVSHRTVVPMGDDLVFMDKVGIASIARAIVSATLSPTRESLLVSRDLQSKLSKFTTGQLQNSLFAIHDRIAQQVLFFVPKGTGISDDNDVYVFCVDKTQKFRAMAYFDAMPYRSGARSADGRIFLSSTTNILYYRNQYEPQYVDSGVPGSQAWDDNTVWDDATGWTDTGAGQTYVGTPITFAMSTPWSDFREPEKFKEGRYLHCMMEGAGIVTVTQYNDRFDNAQLSMQFTMSTAPAVPETTTRPLNNDQLYAWPSKFTRAKLRVSGSTSNGLALLSLGLLYLPGGHRR